MKICLYNSSLQDFHLGFLVCIPLLVVLGRLITFQPQKIFKIHLDNMFEPANHTDTFPLKRKEKRKKEKRKEKIVRKKLTNF
jgi:hypothetical protein